MDGYDSLSMSSTQSEMSFKVESTHFMRRTTSSLLSYNHLSYNLRAKPPNDDHIKGMGDQLCAGVAHLVLYLLRLSVQVSPFDDLRYLSCQHCFSTDHEDRCCSVLSGDFHF